MTCHRFYKTVFFLCVFTMCGLLGSGFAAEGRWLAQEQIHLYGLGLTVDPVHQTVPKDIATIVSTYLQAPDLPVGQELPFPDDAKVHATLRGPSLATPVELVTGLNQHFEIPPLARAGLHSLDNIRVMHNNEVVFYASPPNVTIEVIDQLLVTEITTRALTAEEILEKGIIFDQSNFQAYNFTAAFAVAPGEEIKIDFPVLLPKLEPVSDVQLDVVGIPQLSGGLTKVATIIPDTLKIAQTKIPNLTVKAFTFEIEDYEDKSFDVPPIPGVIVIPGDIGFLNQYFSVMLMVGNGAPENSGLVVSDLIAELVLPPGNDTVVGSGDDPLAMAITEDGEYPQVKPVVRSGPDGKLGTADDISEVAPGQSGNAEFLIEGRREGSHFIEMEISGILTGLPVGPVSIRGRAAGSVLVRNPSFTLTFTHPDIVNDGEEYDLDITVTNTSESPANFVSVNLLSRNISGASLVSEGTQEIETIPAGDSAAVSFRLLSQVTGTVYAATLDSDEKVAGRFELKTSVGELGIPLSPDSLVLPKEAGALPEGLRKASVALLGKAYAAATAPAAALPPDVLRFSKKIVWDRSVEVAGAGLRYSLHEPLTDTVKHLLFDFSGAGFARINELYPDEEQTSLREATEKDFIGFDDLRRRSKRGDAFAAEIAGILAEELAASGAAAFHTNLAEKVSFRPQHLSVLIATDGAPLPYRLSMVDDQGNTVGTIDAETGKIKKEIPFSDYLIFADADDVVTGQMALVSSPQGAAYTIRLERTQGTVSGTPFSLSVVLPADTPSGLRQVVFADISGDELPVIVPQAGDPYTITVEIYDNDQLLQGPSLSPSLTAEIADPLPTVISVVQQPEADRVGCNPPGTPVGRVVAILFSEEVTRPSVQDQFEKIDITNYAPEENVVVGVAQQPDNRIVFLALRDPLGPFIERQITVSAVSDLRGQIMAPWTGPMESTISEEGGVVSGKILQADGTPVDMADVRLFMYGGGCGWIGISAKHAAVDGSFAWDFVVKQKRGKIVAIDPGTGESRSVQFDVSRHGQRLNVNVVFLGRGVLSGRTFAEDGFTPLEATQIMVTSLNDYSRYGATSDEDGNYVIPDIPTGSFIIEAVHLQSRSLVTQTEYMTMAGESMQRDLVLISEPTREITIQYGSVSGHVLESDGATPVAEVPVVAYYRTGTQEGVSCPNAGPPYYDCAVAFTTTDENGLFSFDEIVAGELRIYTFEQARYIEGMARIALPADETKDVNILLSDGLGTVKGIVLDGAGNPVEGAAVGGGMSLTSTDADGLFSLTDVPVGRREIKAVSQALGTEGSVVVDLTSEGEEIYATIVLRQTGNITGTIYEPDSVTPVADLTVYLWYPSQGSIVVAASAVTDASGHYRMDNVIARDGYSLSAFRPDFSAGNVKPVVILFQDQTVNVDITFKGQGRINGVIYDDDGVTPLPAQVSLSALRLQRAGPVGMYFEYTQHLRIVENDFSTGEFSFDNVFVGPFALATAGAFNQQMTTVSTDFGPQDVIDPVTLAGIMPHDGAVIDVALQLSPTSEIEGTVYQPDGVTPVGEDVMVTFRGYKIFCVPLIGCFERESGIQEETVVTDANGHYWLPVVNAGKFELRAEDPVNGNLGQIRGTVQAGQSAEVDFRLLKMVDVNVRVFGSDGVTPIPDAAVELQHAVILDVEAGITNNAGFLEIERSGTADGNGEITFSGLDALPEGELVVLAQNLSNGFAGRASAKITAADDTVTVDVYLFDAVGAVYGTVYEPDGLTPVANAEVIISNEQGNLGFFVADEQGAYRFELMPLGEFDIKVFEAATGRRGIGTGSIDFAGQEVPLNIVEIPIGFVTGTAFASGDLAPLAGWQVEIRQLSPTGQVTPTGESYITWRSSTGVDGSFIFPGITVGTFTLKVFKSGEPSSALVEGRITRQGEVVDMPVVVNMVQSPEGTFSGWAYNPDGTPAANAEICLNQCPPLGLGTTSDTSGAFVFTGVPLGRYTVIASSQVSDDKGRTPVELTFAGETTYVTVIMSGIGTINGNVEWQDGSAANGAMVELFMSASLPERTVFADGSGNFTFDLLVPARYTVVATDPISGMQGAGSVNLSAGDNASLRVVLEPTETVTGTVFFSDSTVAPSILATLASIPYGETTLYGETVADGTFIFHAVPNGSYRLILDDPLGIGRAEKLVSIPGGGSLGNIFLDDTLPEVALADPEPGAVNVSLNQVIEITFSESFDPGTVNLQTVLLTKGSGEQVNGFLTTSNNDTTITFTPLQDFDDESRYILRLSADPPFAALDSDGWGTIDRDEAAYSFAVLVKFDELDTDGNGQLTEDEYPGGIEDLRGHVMAEDFIASFTTVDITTPTAVTVSPTPDTGGVSVSSVIRIVYDEPVDPQEFSGDIITLTGDQGPVTGRIDMILGNIGVVFTPDYPLDVDSSYQVTVLPATDLSGNSQVSGLDYQFTTTDFTAPEIVSLLLSANGEVIQGGIGSVSADVGVSHDVSFVDFYINEVLILADRQPPFTMDFEATEELGVPGETITVAAVATDISGNRGEPLEDAFTIIADALPTANIEVLTPGLSAHTGERVEIRVHAEDDLGLTSVAYQAVGGQFPAFDTIDIDPPVLSFSTPAQVPGLFYFYIPVDAVPGSLVTVLATAVDSRGQAGNAVPVAISVLDATDPSVAFVGLTTGEKVLPGEAITAVVSADDAGGISSLNFTVSGGTSYSESRDINPAQLSVASSFHFTVSPAASPTDMVIMQATAVDAAGNSSTSAQVILPVADTIAPTVSLATQTGSLDIVPGQIVSIVVSAADEIGVSHVELEGSGAFVYADARQVSPPLGSTQLIFDITVPESVSEGETFSLLAIAEDISGNVSPAASLALTVKSLIEVTLPPSLIMMAGDSENVTLSLSAQAPAGGLQVNLVSEDPDVATVPALIVVAAGEDSATFQVSGLKGGLATINALIDSTLSDSMTITVRGGIVTGTVTDELLTPVAGVDLTINGITTVSDASGYFMVEGVLSQSVTIEALDSATGLRGYVTGTMNVANGFLRDVPVVLKAAGKVTGTVMMADGATAAGEGVLVELYLANQNFQDPLQTLFTDSDSQFEFPLVEVGSYDIAVSDISGNRGLAEVTISQSGEEHDVLITFLGRGTVTGTVSDLDGPVANALLTFSSSYALGSDYRTATAGQDGTFTFVDVFIGDFTITAKDPVTQMGATVSGTIAVHEEEVDIALELAEWASLEGYVYRADGSTPVSGARLITTGATWAYTDDTGFYRFEVLPLGTHYVVVKEDKDAGTRGIGEGTVTLDTNGETGVLDINMVGQGTLIITVEDSFGQTVSGADVLVGDSLDSSLRFGWGWPVDPVTDEDGICIVDHVNLGEFLVVAKANALEGRYSGELTADGEVLSFTVTLQPTASIIGTVYGPDEVTPIENVQVRVLGQPGNETFITGVDGEYSFSGRLLSLHTLEAYEGGEVNIYGNYVGGQLRAKVRDILLDTNGQVVEQDLVLVALGTVQGRVLMPDSSSASGMAVTVRSLTPDFGKTYSTTTDAAGYYTVERVAAGDFTVSSGDLNQQLLGEGEGVIVDDGETITVDIVLSNNAITLPETLYDGNIIRFDIQDDGTIETGLNSLFSQYYYGSLQGGAVLTVIDNGTPISFSGGLVSTEEELGRELVVRENDLAGLNVTRKIYVPGDGYFARYLEIFTNPSAADITVDVQIDSNFNYSRTDIIVASTSTGDTVLQAGDVATADHWAVVDDSNESSPLEVTSYNIPPSAFIWNDSDAALPPDALTFSSRVDNYTPSSLSASWNQLTIPAGQSVALMHFVVQQISRDAAEASAQRLEQLPPEALAGLSLSEIELVVNFDMSEDGSSSLTPLAPLTSTVSGQVWASDLTTFPPIYSDVFLTSDNLFFGRTYKVDVDANGFFTFVSEPGGQPEFGDLLIPLDSFTLWAEVNIGSIVTSPVVAGEFPDGQNTAELDIVFSNTGIFEGTVRKATGVVAGGVEVEARMSPYDADDTTAADGFYQIAFLPPGEYTVTASEPYPLTYVETSEVATIIEGGSVVLDLTLPPLGNITGVVRDENDLPIYYARVTLRNYDGDYFHREVRTDYSGQYTFTDVPVGTYELTVYDTDSNGRLTTLITVLEEDTVVSDFTLPPFMNLPVTLYDGNGFIWDVQSDGRIYHGTDNAYSSYDYGLDLYLGSTAFSVTPAVAIPEDNSRELFIGTMVSDDIQLSRKVFVPDNDAFVRYLEIIDNTGVIDQDVPLEIRSDFGSLSNTELLATSFADGLGNELDDYIITDDAIDAGGTPAMVHVFSGFGQVLEPTAVETTAPGDNDLDYNFVVNVPAGERRIIMHFASQNSSRLQALASADYLHCLQGNTLNGLSAEEEDAIVNFIAVADSDCDGLHDEDEVMHGTDPLDVDSDGDGLLDGFEVLYGFDPLSPGDELGDGDNDGLDNLSEQTAGSDPTNVDTDGGSLWDGDEILMGTNPLDPTDDLFSLPLTLLDGSGFIWDIQTDGRIRRGTNDAYYYYYGGLDLLVDSVSYPSFSTAMREDMSREVVIGPSVSGDITVQRKIFVPDDDTFVRYLEIVENSSATETITTTLRIDSDVGSRYDTEIIGTSSGDVSFSEDDRYIITDDENDGSGNPAMLHLFAGVNGDEQPAEVYTNAPGNDDIWYEFEVSVAPGERKIIMHFASQNISRNDAILSAEQLRCLQGSALAGLSGAEITDIVNFVVITDSDCDGLNDEKETAFGTDPDNPDSDGDGLLDGYEVDYGFDPLVGGEESQDPDGDGLDNISEQTLGTDPLNWDSDADGISDGDEVNRFGTDPLFAGIFLTDNQAMSDHGVSAIDSLGNIHVVWTDFRDGNPEIYYTMLSPGGGTLIDDTRLTSDSAYSKRPDIAVDSQNHVHVIWHDKRLSYIAEIFHTLIDPSLHSQNGSSAVDADIVISDDQLVSNDDSVMSHFPQLAVDSQDRAHMIWHDDQDEGELHHAVFDASGSVVLADHMIYTSGVNQWWPVLPNLAIDGNDNLHIVWNDLLGELEVFYTMVDGTSGDTLIAPTALTEADNDASTYASIGVDGRDRLTVVFSDERLYSSGGDTEVFMLRIDPSRDDQDGNAAGREELTVLPALPITDVNDGEWINFPAASVDSQGSAYLSWYEKYDYSGYDHGEMLFKAVAADGSTIFAELSLTDGLSTASTTSERTFGFVAQRGITSYVTWTDNRRGDGEVMLRIINPDMDNDGLTNGEEIVQGTDAYNPDSDGDSLLDGFEVRYGFDPLSPGEENGDPDGDGLSNSEEQAAGTDPTQADIDGDGLDDSDEVQVYFTDPFNSDTDGDGLSDGEEVTANTDPLLGDSDGDGLLDGFELVNGFDPLSPGEQGLDSDSDGLTNLVEQETGTLPLNPDSDGDGLSDGDEVNIWLTDPLNEDSDLDGFTDGDEVLHGTDPLIPFINLTDGTSVSDHAMVAVDSAGNAHLVWEDNRSGNFEIYYAMYSALGQTLIDSTRLTSDGDISMRPALAVNNLGQVHVVWQDQRLGRNEIFHSLLDPNLHPQDGSSALDGALALVDDQLLSLDDGIGDSHPRLVTDSLDRLHVVWNRWPCVDTGEGIVCSPSDIRYLRLDSDGTGGQNGQTLFSQFTWEGPMLPSITVDSADDLHLVWTEAAIFYEMIDGDTGATLIDHTTFSGEIDPGYTTILAGSDDKMFVFYEDAVSWDDPDELFMMCIDPSLDDLSGDSADVNAITTMAASVISADTEVSAKRPAAALAADGNFHISYLSEYSGYPPLGDLLYRVVDQTGTVVTAERALTSNTTATSTDEPSAPSVATKGGTTFVTWTDNYSGQAQVLLRVIPGL